MSEDLPAQPPEGVGLAGLREAAAGCRACELWEPATQTVFGVGPETARIVLVGEQPGDQEDRTGEPFVGPAGKLLDRALADAGIDRRDAYVTTAVKHFRFEPRGKRRIHQAPGPEHLHACLPWLAVLCLAVAGAGDMVSAVLRSSMLQLAAPDAMRGRMQGVFIVVVAGGPRLGDLRAGAIASAAGVSVAMVSGGVVVIVAMIVVALIVPSFWLFRASRSEEVAKEIRPGSAA
jgi:uracil-DNA glycosylase family 4